MSIGKVEPLHQPELQLADEFRGRRVKTLLIFLGSILIFLIAPMVGIKTISYADALGSGSEANIFWEMRIPRVLGSFIVGGALAAGGLVFQTMFRNPLATPFTLGVSGGASLGAVIFFHLGIPFSILGISGSSLFAFAGAIGAIMIVYSISTIRPGFSSTSMLLAGVAISFFFASLILFIQYMSDFTASYRIIRWLMGALESVDYGKLSGMAPLVLIGWGVVFANTRELNLISLGDDLAISRGVDVRRVRKILFFATSLMIGGVVSVCGPIGFVGLMAPHIIRLIAGPDIRYTAPASIMFGGAFLTVCDAIARSIIAPAEIPVGVITAMLGGPFFIWLLSSRNAREFSV